MVGLNKADKLASALSLLVAVAALVAPYVLSPGQPSSAAAAAKAAPSGSTQLVTNTVVGGNLTHGGRPSKNSFATAWRCRGMRQLGPLRRRPVRVAGGWGLLPWPGNGRAGRKVHSGAGVPLVVTGLAWTVRGRK